VNLQPPVVRGLGRVLGWTLSLACLVWLVRLALRHATGLPTPPSGSLAFAGLSGSVLLHVLTLIAGGAAWKLLLAACGAPARLRLALGIHLFSQPAKYLPGNVGQLVGRVALGRRHGIALSPLLRTLALEAAGVVAAAAVCLLAALALGGIEPPRGLPPAWVLGALTAAGLAVAAVVLARKSPGSAPALSGALLLYLGIFGIYGASALLLLRTLLGHAADVGLLACAGAFAAGWIGGFFTPGAPAGLGVREAILVTLLAPRLGPEVALGLAVAFRVVTTLGDGVGFVVGMAALRGAPNPPRAQTSAQTRV
jgi:hypothetical protein